MGSKREEERNEKIIRGLMKLPPNRRCINCNSLGPQYVCTNFWTFVCMVCSGIHREFTHRVKSVSMSKFTSHEVEALLNGGNQRARETFLQDWDLQRQRLPNSSNVDKVREFIKAVYVDRKYAGGNKSDKPPRDMESQTNTGDEIRRASSYHSYSQSPPYDFQYEDRLKRKQGASLTRKPGSDRGLYEWRAASFVCSPARLNEHMYEDRFANEGSSSRVSDYSVSSGGDPFKSGHQSPNLQKDGLSSPISDSSRELVDSVQNQTMSTYPEAYAKRDADRVPVPRPQRTVSSGSFGSSDGNSVPFQPVDSGSGFDVYFEDNQSAVTLQNKVSMLPSLSESVENSGMLDLFKDSVRLPASSSAPSVNLFQAPKAGLAAPIDLFQLPADSSTPSESFSEPQMSSSSSSSHSKEVFQRPPVPTLNQKLPEPSEPSNEGWATFDIPQHNAPVTDILAGVVPEAHSEVGTSLKSVNPVFPLNVGFQWQDFQSSTAHELPQLASNPWNEDLQNVHVPTNMPSTPQWKAFEEANEQNQFVDVQHGIDFPGSLENPSSTTDQFPGLKTLEETSIDGFPKPTCREGASIPTLLSHVNQPNPPFMSEMMHTGQKSGNPFDIPFDSEMEVSGAFLDMNTLQAALPNTLIPSPYVGGINDSWFDQNPVASQGGFSYMTTQVPSSQLPNVLTHEHVASIGGNPFA